jgi:hypothetical protein
MDLREMGCRSPVTVVSFLPPYKIVTTNYLMGLFFCNFFHFFFNFCPQKLFVENTPSQNKICEGEILFCEGVFKICEGEILMVARV